MLAHFVFSLFISVPKKKKKTFWKRDLTDFASPSS